MGRAGGPVDGDEPFAPAFSVTMVFASGAHGGGWSGDARVAGVRGAEPAVAPVRARCRGAFFLTTREVCATLSVTGRNKMGAGTEGGPRW